MWPIHIVILKAKSFCLVRSWWHQPLLWECSYRWQEDTDQRVFLVRNIQSSDLSSSSKPWTSQKTYAGTSVLQAVNLSSLFHEIISGAPVSVTRLRRILPCSGIVLKGQWLADIEPYFPELCQLFSVPCLHSDDSGISLSGDILKLFFEYMRRPLTRVAGRFQVHILLLRSSFHLCFVCLGQIHSFM